jgi:hypothetical protein
MPFGNGKLRRHAIPPMAAQELYDALRDTIDVHIDLDTELSTFELLGVLRMITAELEAAALEATAEDEDG